MKVLVVIRHGESEYNAAARQADNWVDPKLYDPSLTARGCQQARQLRERLAQELTSNQSILSGQESTVWVTSPLRRCIQTFLLSCPLLPDSHADQVGATQSHASVPAQVQEKLDLIEGHELPPVRIVRCFLQDCRAKVDSAFLFRVPTATLSSCTPKVDICKYI